MYVSRTIEKTLVSMAQSFPCMALYGSRQVGKSTTIDYLFGSSYEYVTLDDSEELSLALHNPKLFFEAHSWPLVIDEIQKAPSLLSEIKIIIDTQRLIWLKNGGTRTLMFVLTGSNRYELQQGISESLAGRCGILEMTSLSFAEKNKYDGLLFIPDSEMLLLREKEKTFHQSSRISIFEHIFEGGMPDVFTGASERAYYFQSYVSTYIEKDVRKLINATNELTFRNFMQLLALRTAQELHWDALSKDAGIDVKTAKRWISILESSGIISLIHPYLPNKMKRVIKAPKIYFMDTGLCAYLCKWPSAEMLMKGAMSGAFFETYVVSEMFKNYLAHGMNPHDYFYYYRDTDQKEIDLVYVSDTGLVPIEIKKGINPSSPTKNFSVLKKYQQEIKKGLIIECCQKMRPLNENAYCYPVSHIGW